MILGLTLLIAVILIAISCFLVSAIMHFKVKHQYLVDSITEIQQDIAIINARDERWFAAVEDLLPKACDAAPQCNGYTPYICPYLKKDLRGKVNPVNDKGLIMPKKGSLHEKKKSK